MANILAIDEVVFHNILLAIEDERWGADYYDKNKDELENTIYADVDMMALLDKYYIFTNMIIEMTRRCYSLTNQAVRTFEEIGNHLLELDETISITLSAEESNYK